jgi:hypothetical protein
MRFIERAGTVACALLVSSWTALGCDMAEFDEADDSDMVGGKADHLPAPVGVFRGELKLLYPRQEVLSRAEPHRFNFGVGEPVKLAFTIEDLACSGTSNLVLDITRWSDGERVADGLLAPDGDCQTQFELDLSEHHFSATYIVVVRQKASAASTPYRLVATGEIRCGRLERFGGLEMPCPGNGVWSDVSDYRCINYRPRDPDDPALSDFENDWNKLGTCVRRDACRGDLPFEERWTLEDECRHAGTCEGWRCEDVDPAAELGICICES